MIEVIPYSSEFSGRVYDLIKQFHEESLDEYGLELDNLDLSRYEDTHGATTFLMMEDGKVIGVLSGQVVKQPMSDIHVYQESIWYVDKNHRKSGIRLVRHLEQWCKDNDIDQIVMAFMHNSMSEKVYAFYQRLGYKPMETHLIKDVV